MTADEYRLVKSMLEHGEAAAAPFLAQLESALVTSWTCPCGCASFDMIVNGVPRRSGEKGMQILADFIFGPEEEPSGIFVFAVGGALAGLEVYGMAGDASKSPPNFEALRNRL